MICIAVANDTPSVAAPGSKGPVFGSNPFAFAAPGGAHPPVMLDMSTAVVAGGKVWQSVAAGKPIPEGWLVDTEGRATTDGTLYPDNASLLPVGGFKGYGLAIMIDVLAGVLSGANIRDKVGAWVYNPDTPTHHGHAFIVIDPRVINGSFESFQSGMNELIDGVKTCDTVPSAGASASMNRRLTTSTLSPRFSSNPTALRARGRDALQLVACVRPARSCCHRRP